MGGRTIKKRRIVSRTQTSPVSGLVLFLLCVLLPVSLAYAEKWHFPDVERIVAVGDIHGAYDGLIATLQGAGVIDDKLAWSGGKTHLVFTGDLLDRGAKSRDVMDLVMRLEKEALRDGGRVHLVLGNHEVMNLTGDLRYVANAEYIAFLDMEKRKERRRWYKRFKNGTPEDMDESTVLSQFNKKAPPGFFGHRRAFRHDGIYGKWLLEKPFIVVVNETAFVHGGLPAFVAEYGLEGPNVTLKQHLNEYVVTRDYLADNDVMSPIDRFKEIPKMFAGLANAGQIPDEYLDEVQTAIDLSESPLHWGAGPTWYRGTAMCNQLVEGDSLNRVFSRIGASRVVMGHTSTVTRLVQQRMNGQVVEIDTGMLKSTYKGSGNALVIEGDALSVVNEDGRNDLSPIDHPLRVGHESLAISDAEMADILANGTIADPNGGGATWKIVTVTKGEHTVSAYFRELKGAEEGDIPELAAYRLDRLLGLDMIPATVRRVIGDRKGIMQFIPEDAITELHRVASGRGKEMYCSREKQVAVMHVFDALINNQGRTPLSMLYSPDDWLLILIGHDTSFSTEVERPEYLRDIELTVGDQWRAALGKLDDDVLRAELGDVLNEDQLLALASRRDSLLGND
ncbi:MAG: metallophosphoesterase [Gammaproteobacteria bacterium]|nr:metallophosphoesterase [Gammaproteobacteria bacterium]